MISTADLRITPGLLKLSHLVFFDPNPQFINWLIRYAGNRRIVDSGCGAGRLSARLRQKGATVLPVDVCHRDNPEVDDILFLDACVLPYSPNDLVIVARPDHSGWHYDTIDRALACGAEVLYIGLDRNIEIDLYELEYDILRRNVGAEQEKVYKIHSR